MARSSKRSSDAGQAVALQVPAAPADTSAATQAMFKVLGGTDQIDFNEMLILQAVSAGPKRSVAEGEKKQPDGVLAGMIALAPRDAQEGMIITQMLGLHSATMECLRRAAIEGQTNEGREMNLNHANKLSRSYAMLVDTLGRHRGGGTQKIIVERVTVNAGGQAIVGNLDRAGEGAPAKQEEQPHAKQLTYAPVTALPGLDAPCDALSVPRDAERPLSHARRPLPRRTQGQ